MARNINEPCRTGGIDHLWIYDEGYDEFFCPLCDIWAYDNGCDDPDCYFNCTRRPKFPSEMEDFFSLTREEVKRLNDEYEEDFPDGE